MYNPYPYDDPRAVNKPVLPEKVTSQIVQGTAAAAAFLAEKFSAQLASSPGGSVVAGFDGYISADWTRMLNLISQQLRLRSLELVTVDFAAGVYKSGEEINAMIDPLLEWDREKDPTLLYGRLFGGGYEAIFDEARYAGFKKRLDGLKKTPGKVVIVFGNGCAVKELRPLYDTICFFDVTPKESILRARRGQFANLGDSTARPASQVIRRCYYADFEMALEVRGELIRENLIDYYIASDSPGGASLLPRDAFNAVLAALVRYPLRAKPVYLEGVWGGTYVKDLRGLPDAMRNCAWVFDLIPMEVSIVVEAGGKKVEFPFYTFVQKEGLNLMGRQCVDRFGGYFPIRFNYDDTYHSSGNMSIQVHSGHDYNVENYNELGRQDESYYVIATGHGARTYVGFRDDADPKEFIRAIKLADTEYKPVDYEKYVHYEESKPGMQVMLPAGTIHSSGRNQVILEIGSLTIGSYTYKLYDYLRADFDGKPRPIHTWHGERTLAADRNKTWVRRNIVRPPQLTRSGDGWAEYIVGRCDMLYFSLHRFEFEKSIEDDTSDKFHVLTLVDGERVRVRSVENPEHGFQMQFMDIVVVPANMGRYVIENLGTEPICVHKTMLKDGFAEE